MTPDLQNRFPALVTIEQAPFARLLNLVIESADVGEAVTRMPFDASLLNAGGLDVPIHGGAIASLADITACAAVWTMPETQNTATITITVNYTGPGIRSDLVAHARVRRKGRRVAHLAVEVRDGKDELVADALVTYKIA